VASAQPFFTSTRVRPQRSRTASASTSDRFHQAATQRLKQHDSIGVAVGLCLHQTQKGGEVDLLGVEQLQGADLSEFELLAGEPQALVGGALGGDGRAQRIAIELDRLQSSTGESAYRRRMSSGSSTNSIDWRAATRYPPVPDLAWRSPGDLSKPCVAR
jgi:hypothetical protein